MDQFNSSSLCGILSYPQTGQCQVPITLVWGWAREVSQTMRPGNNCSNPVRPMLRTGNKMTKVPENGE